MTARTYTPREAYEEDCRRQPLYHDGGVRPSWERLSDVAKWSWVKNPTPRDCTAPAISKSEETR